MRHSQWYLKVSIASEILQMIFIYQFTACGTSGSSKNRSKKDEEENWEKETTTHIVELHQLLYNCLAKTSGAHFIECGSRPGFVDRSACTLDDAIKNHLMFAPPTTNILLSNLKISFVNIKNYLFL